MTDQIPAEIVRHQLDSGSRPFGSDAVRMLLAERDQLAAALTAIRTITIEATTDDAALLRRSVLDQVPQDAPQPHAERVAHQFEGRGTVDPAIGPQRGAGDVETPTADAAARRVKHWLIQHPGRATAARFPIDDLWTLLDERSDRAAEPDPRLTAAAHPLVTEQLAAYRRTLLIPPHAGSSTSYGIAYRLLAEVDRLQAELGYALAPDDDPEPLTLRDVDPGYVYDCEEQDRIAEKVYEPAPGYDGEAPF